MPATIATRLSSGSGGVGRINCEAVIRLIGREGV